MRDSPAYLKRKKLDRIALKSAAFVARWLPSPFRRAIYRFPSLSRFIRNQLNQVAPVGLVEVKIAAGPLSGRPFFIDMQTEKDYWLGTYETDLQAAISFWVRPGMVVYDIGANVGYVTLMLELEVGQTGRVVAFEALPANMERLVRNITINDLEDRVTALNYAIIDKPGRTRFWIGPSDDMGKAEGSAGRSEITYSESIQVDGMSLDWFIYEMNNLIPDVLKVDIEGGEVLALPGMTRLLKEAHPLILLELHGPQAAQVCWEILTNCTYHIHRIDKGFQEVRKVEELDWKSYLIAIPEK